MKRIRNGLIIPPLILISLGLVELFFINRGLFLSQLSKVIIYSLLLAGFYFLIKKPYILNYGPIIYYISIPLLIATLLFGKGGVSRWIGVGALTFQPSELTKLGLIFVLGKTLSDTKKTIKTKLTKALIYTLIPFILVMLQPDLGTALTLLIIAFITIWVYGVDPMLIRLAILIPIAMLTSAHIVSTIIFYIMLLSLLIILKEPIYKKILTIGILTLTSLSTPIVWQKMLKPYQRDRLTAFLNPEKSLNKEGWQIYQAKIAMGSGGIIGKGPGKGTQKGLAFLPAAHTDFIFSSFGEEFGLLGLIVILFTFIIFFRTILRTLELKEGNEKLIVSGIFAYFFIHFTFNILSNLSLLPVVGIPLPFLSFGGSHLLTEMASILTLLKLEV
ncbi:MAG TPA: rod shape-determining protein RodA [Candidatus Hydrothermia bacterium]|nr:rod shape-determining protein RodA [Candidatus Hydrothermae bacterium]MDD3649063.1 rod shape-determining protein RodA [Candidatus Hydrothermia bacterium]MDD5573415.1 rod shape-determining protein RodA [Candidatus Hydrothermia bacterium]HOK23002.1 rod shape-determining protein RodA [Candidatus Hydrothermia bacterium]HOL23738.1 rod shape-determining protein RodA [Candidatus Hydrothermia bacterium]